MTTGRQGLVSIVTPTRNRSSFLSRSKSFVLSQNYENIEWLILDDSIDQDLIFKSISDKHIVYEHTTQNFSLGDKRNYLIEKSRGEFIVQFDDDDYYSPNYVSAMMSILCTKKADIANLTGWFLLDLRWKFFGYWDLVKKSGQHYCCDATGVSTTVFDADIIEAMRDNEYGYGFTYAFRRTVWERCRFPAINLGEDSAFFLRAKENFRTASLSDGIGLCLHTLHPSSTSRCFPQYRIPNFLLSKFFPDNAFIVN